MSARTPLSLFELKSKAVTSSPFTSNFRHLLPVKKELLTRDKLSPDPPPKAAATKDRIKWWNIVPGDQVCVMAHKDGPIRDVVAVNKISNRVFLRRSANKASNPHRNPRKRPDPHENIHYSGVRLFLGNYDFPSPDGSGSKNLPVFALRMSTTEPRWEGGRWVWDRFATATVPRLPSWSRGQQDRIPIPWPETEKWIPPDPTSYDAQKEVVEEVTYEPSVVADTPHPSVVTVSDEQADLYVEMLRGSKVYDQSFPSELLIARELSNPHSRAKKRARYLVARNVQRALLREYIDNEVKNVGQRTRREARAEAIYKWQVRVRADRRAELKRRSIARGVDARLARKQKKRQEKLERVTRRLNELVLEAAPNQVVPQIP